MCLVPKQTKAHQESQPVGGTWGLLGLLLKLSHSEEMTQWIRQEPGSKNWWFQIHPWFSYYTLSQKQWSPEGSVGSNYSNC